MKSNPRIELNPYSLTPVADIQKELGIPVTGVFDGKTQDAWLAKLEAEREFRRNSRAWFIRSRL